MPSDGRSGGLALFWREGIDVRFKSCSNSHIDVVVHGVAATEPWHATGFYGHPDASKRHISWKLFETLRAQCDMAWVIFRDFNKILNSGEKLGGADRDAKQMAAFGECLDRCRLIDLGFVGQKYTWCNGRHGEQRTKLGLDRVVANGKWMESFGDAKLVHVSMPISDHCLLSLRLSKDQRRRPSKRRFMFKAMWTKDERCRNIVELAWDPDRGDPHFVVSDRIKRCQEQLQRWNWLEFGNVGHTIKQKREQLQQLEALNSLHDRVDEIQTLKREINEALSREEIMWCQ